MENIILHVTYTCKPGAAEAFVRTLKQSGLQEQVRGEEGCIQYDYHLSCEQPDTVVLLERWRDDVCLQAHTHGEAIQGIGALKSDYVLHVELERFQ